MTIALFLFAGFASALIVTLVMRKFASFSAQSPDDYSNGPEFDIRAVLNRPLVCEGIIYGPTGRVSSRFTAEMECHWRDNVCLMSEEFHYDSGNQQHREWTLKLAEDGTIEATAPDVIGIGTGRQRGSAVVLNYRIKLTEDAGGHVLNVTDWMYLLDNGAIMNRSEFRKFGIKVAELVATMRPALPTAMAAE